MTLVAALAGSALAQRQPTPAPAPAPGPGPLPAESSPPLESPEEKPAPPPPPPPPAAPASEGSSGGISGGDAALMVGAGVGLTAGVLLFASSRWDKADADSARSYGEYERISARSDRLLIASALAAGAGVTLAVISAVRVKKARDNGTDIAIAPNAGGATVVLGRTW